MIDSVEHFFRSKNITIEITDMRCFAPDLYISVTLATFQSVGNTPVRIDWLKISVSEGAIAGASIFRILAEI